MTVRYELVETARDAVGRKMSTALPHMMKMATVFLHAPISALIRKERVSW